MDIINAFPGYEFVDGKIYIVEQMLEKVVMFMRNQECMATLHY